MRKILIVILVLFASAGPIYGCGPRECDEATPGILTVDDGLRPSPGSVEADLETLKHRLRDRDTGDLYECLLSSLESAEWSYDGMEDGWRRFTLKGRTYQRLPNQKIGTWRIFTFRVRGTDVEQRRLASSDNQWDPIE